MLNLGFTIQERKIMLALASIFALRMLGLFMILPIFATNADQFTNASEQLIGWAIGIYGLMQALLQIPLGCLSDRVGRKLVIFIGLLVFACGSMVAAASHSIYGVIVGRCLQGSAAIGCVIMAAVADYTREKVRHRAMGMLGMIIGIAFAIAIVMGPIINQWLGIRGIFGITTILAMLAIVVLLLALPKSSNMLNTKDIPALSAQLSACLTKFELLDVNIGVFSLHATLAALFLVLPGLIQQAGCLPQNLWQLYLLTLSLAFAAGMLLIVKAEQQNKTHTLPSIALVAILVGQCLLLTYRSNLSMIVIALLIFFMGFSILEANLPARVAKCIGNKHKGTAMGLYSSFQFLGIFFGGTIGGWLHGHYGVTAVLVLCMLIIMAWLVCCKISYLKLAKQINN